MKNKMKGVHISNFGDHYHAYRSRSIYDKKTKKTKTLPGKYLGVVTHHGIVKKSEIVGIRSDHT